MLVEDGNTYDRHAIEQWLESGNNTSPMTGEVLTQKGLVPNHLVRSQIAEAGLTPASD